MYASREKCTRENYARGWTFCFRASIIIFINWKISCRSFINEASFSRSGNFFFFSADNDSININRSVRATWGTMSPIAPRSSFPWHYKDKDDVYSVGVIIHTPRQQWIPHSPEKCDRAKTRTLLRVILRALAREASHVEQKSSPLKREHSWKIPLSDHVGKTFPILVNLSNGSHHISFFLSFCLSVAFSVFFMNIVCSIYSKESFRIHISGGDECIKYRCKYMYDQKYI